MPQAFKDTLVCVPAQTAYCPETEVFWEIMKQRQERQRPRFLGSTQAQPKPNQPILGLKIPDLWESIISCELQCSFLFATKEHAFHLQGVFQKAL